MSYSSILFVVIIIAFVSIETTLLEPQGSEINLGTPSSSSSKAQSSSSSSSYNTHSPLTGSPVAAESSTARATAEATSSTNSAPMTGSMGTGGSVTGTSADASANGNNALTTGSMGTGGSATRASADASSSTNSVSTTGSMGTGGSETLTSSDAYSNANSELTTGSMGTGGSTTRASADASSSTNSVSTTGSLGTGNTIIRPLGDTVFNINGASTTSWTASKAASSMETWSSEYLDDSRISPSADTSSMSGNPNTGAVSKTGILGGDFSDFYRSSALTSEDTGHGGATLGTGTEHTFQNGNPCKRVSRKGKCGCGVPNMIKGSAYEGTVGPHNPVIKTVENIFGKEFANTVSSVEQTDDETTEETTVDKDKCLRGLCNQIINEGIAAAEADVLAKRSPDAGFPASGSTRMDAPAIDSACKDGKCEHTCTGELCAGKHERTISTPHGGAEVYV